MVRTEGLAIASCDLGGLDADTDGADGLRARAEADRHIALNCGQHEHD